MLKRLKCFVLLLIGICCFCSCKTSLRTQDLSKTMAEIEKAVDLQDMMDLSLDDVAEMYFIEKKDIKQLVAKINNNGYDTDEIIFCEAANRDASQRILEAVQKRCEEKHKQAVSYNPEGDSLIEKAKQEITDNFVSFIVSAKAEQIYKIYKSAF